MTIENRLLLIQHTISYFKRIAPRSTLEAEYAFHCSRAWRESVRYAAKTFCLSRAEVRESMRVLHEVGSLRGAM